MILKQLSTTISVLATITLATAQPVAAVTIELIGLTDSNTLVFFKTNALSLTTNVPVTGLQGSENLVGIDFSSSNGKLFGVTDLNRIFTIDTTTGLATVVSNSPTPFTLSGTAFGVDFNPIPNAIRVVSDTEQNNRLNPNTGGIAAGAPDTNLVYSSGDINFGTNPNIVGAAYTNSFSPSPRSGPTTLYVIDSSLDILARQGGLNFTAPSTNPPSPNTGQLFTVGGLGVDFGNGGFDILSTSDPNGLDIAFAASGSLLYNIDLSTGSANFLGTIGNGNISIIGLASSITVPESSGLVPLFGLSGLILLSRLRFSRKSSN